MTKKNPFSLILKAKKNTFKVNLLEQGKEGKELDRPEEEERKEEGKEERKEWRPRRRKRKEKRLAKGGD